MFLFGLPKKARLSLGQGLFISSSGLGVFHFPFFLCSYDGLFGSFIRGLLIDWRHCGYFCNFYIFGFFYLRVDGCYTEGGRGVT